MQQPIDKMQQLLPISLTILIRIKSTIEIHKYCWQLARREVLGPYKIKLFLKISSGNLNLDAFLLLSLESVNLIQKIFLQIK